VSEFLLTLFWFAVTLGVLVVFHEFGHFAMAKLFGVGVESFSIGFGPRLIGFRRGETDYRISAIPLGGYVKMVGETPDDEAAGDPSALGARPRWQRFLIFVIGAVLNIVLAIALMTVVFMRIGKPADAADAPPLVRSVTAGSAAEARGVRAGDRLVQVGGKDASNPVTAIEEIFLSPGTTKQFVFDRNGKRITADLPIGYDPKYHSGDPGLQLASGVSEAPAPPEATTILAVSAGTPAEQAGILPGDRIVGVDGRAHPSRPELIALISSSPGRSVTLQVERGTEILEILVTPAVMDGAGRIGVEFAPYEGPRIPLGPAEAFAESLKFNRENATLLLVTLKKLVIGDVSLRVMSGPIEIATAARQAAGDGLDSVLHFMAFVSLQLGIINLLPIPMLDGGHIFILLIEGILRRDLSVALKERVMQAGLIFLLLFAGLVISLDLIKRAS